MSVLQQFTSHSEPPVPPPPPAATPEATSVRQQLSEQVGTPLRAGPLWHSQWPMFPAHGFTDPTLRGSGESQVTFFHSTGASPLAEWIRILGGAKPRELAPELPYNLWGVSYQEPLAGSELRILEQAYVLEDRSAIPAFIKRSRLLEPLLEAQGPLTSAFGEATVKKLTLVEDDEGFVTLFCLMLVPGGLDEARWALNRFDESWWLARSHEADGKLNFDFELI